MPADRLDLASRIAAATPRDTVRGVAINAAFEAAREHGGDATVLLCDPTGKGRRGDPTDYPVADALAVAWAVADRLERKLGGVDPAFEAMGRHVAAGFLRSLRGRALLLLGRNPRAILGRLPAAYQATVSFGQRYLDWPEADRCRIELDHDFLPLAWHRGLIAAMLEAAGAKDPVIDGRTPGFMKAVFDVRWG